MESPVSYTDSAVVIRAIDASDNIVLLTELLHRAYAPLGARGLRFWATHQTPEDTKERLSLGHTIVALHNGCIVGTVTIRPHDPDSEVELYRNPKACILNQFAVEPVLQGIGIGRRLHQAAISRAQKMGATHILLDTAEQATELISLYEHWGYVCVGMCDWRPFTNYDSVILQLNV